MSSQRAAGGAAPEGGNAPVVMREAVIAMGPNGRLGADRSMDTGDACRTEVHVHAPGAPARPAPGWRRWRRC